jgi:hypothetical protein
VLKDAFVWAMLEQYSLFTVNFACLLHYINIIYVVSAECAKRIIQVLEAANPCAADAVSGARQSKSSSGATANIIGVATSSVKRARGKLK